MATGRLTPERVSAEHGLIGGGALEPVCALDEETPPGTDPSEGLRIGPYEVYRSLVRDNPKTLIAFHVDPASTGGVVLLRRVAEEGAEHLAANARLAVSLSHQNLEKALGIERSEHGTFWVSELVPGATLMELRVASKKARASLPMGLQLAAVYDAAKGLQRVHANAESFSGPRRAAHGLLRPHNIVLALNGRAVLLNPQYLAYPTGCPVEAQPLIGNAGYLSPEAVRGESLDPRSDVFVLGALAYEAATDKVLFTGQTPQQRAQAVLSHTPVPPSRLNLSLNAEVDQVILKALSQNPAERFPSAEAFAQAFQRVAGPYMAKEAQRAEILARLLSARPQRLHALTDLLNSRQAAARALEAERREAEERQRALEREREQKAQAERAAQAAKEEARRAAAAAAAAAATAAAAAAPPRPAAKPNAPPARALPPRYVLFAGGGALALVLVLLTVLLLRKPAPVPPSRVDLPMPPPPVLAPRKAEPVAAPPSEAQAAAEETPAPPPPPKKKKRTGGAPIPSWLK